MAKIFIIGSGGFGKEVLALIKQIGGYIIEGFVDVTAMPDINVGKESYKVYPEEYLETLDYKPLLVIGVGTPALVRKIASKFQDEYEFPNLIHPGVIANFEDIALGKGNIITANCIFTTSITIGSFNIFNLNCTVGHDVVIGSYNVINPMVNVSGGVTVGDTNLIGVSATILQHKSIGSNSIVGASSLVTKDVADNVMVVGVPALKVKNLA